MAEKTVMRIFSAGTGEKPEGRFFDGGGLPEPQAPMARVTKNRDKIARIFHDSCPNLEKSDDLPVFILTVLAEPAVQVDRFPVMFM